MAPRHDNVLNPLVEGNHNAPSHYIKPSDKDLQVPHIAWPTLALMFGAAAIRLASIYAYGVLGMIPLSVACVIGCVCTFALFTPMHDAAHRSVSKINFLNEWTGRICAAFFIHPFAPFRFVHLEHHVHTNHPEKDPDMWSGTGPWFLLPLKWATQEIHYYVIYIPATPRRALSEAFEAYGTMMLLYYGVYNLFQMFPALPVFLLVVAPGRIAGMGLGYAFDYLPHRPHTVTNKENKFLATSNVGDESAFSSVVLLYQNYHLIHHIWPKVPFYRYVVLWNNNKPALQAKGARFLPILWYNRAKDLASIKANKKQ